ncbi:MAG: cytochrome B [Alphaproteobacteria bacterium PA2]|nr:MAG: cytochrome B [Alphaproteobacteria bacterium PA2]
MSGIAQPSAPTPRRWDPIVKLTHWGIVVAVIGNALVTKEGSGWHIWVGYGLAALLALRLLWGFIGPAEARFSAFPPSPSRAIGHIGEISRGDVTRHRSHNPLGALMVYAIWACLLVVIGSGIAMSGPPPADPTARREHSEEMTPRQGQAPLAPPEARGEEAGEGEEGEGGEGEEEEGGVLGEVHETAVYLLYLLIALHLGGVVFETRRSGREIITAMIPGGKPKQP